MAKKCIVDQYVDADDGARVDIILNNYTGFTRMLDGYVKSLSASILDERNDNYRSSLGNLGVRVQSSNISNPTFNDAAGRTDIEAAINAGDWISALKGSNDVLDRRSVVETIGKMRYHYDIVSGQVEALEDKDYKVFMKYLDSDMTYDELADFFKTTYESIKTRVYRARSAIKLGSLDMMNHREMKCA